MNDEERKQKIVQETQEALSRDGSLWNDPNTNSKIELHSIPDNTELHKIIIETVRTTGIETQGLDITVSDQGMFSEPNAQMRKANDLGMEITISQSLINGMNIQGVEDIIKHEIQHAKQHEEVVGTDKDETILKQTADILYNIGLKETATDLLISAKGSSNKLETDADFNMSHQSETIAQLAVITPEFYKKTPENTANDHPPTRARLEVAVQKDLMEKETGLTIKPEDVEINDAGTKFTLKDHETVAAQMAERQIKAEHNNLPDYEVNKDSPEYQKLVENNLEKLAKLTPQKTMQIEILAKVEVIKFDKLIDNILAEKEAKPKHAEITKIPHIHINETPTQPEAKPITQPEPITPKIINKTFSQSENQNEFAALAEKYKDILGGIKNSNISAGQDHTHEQPQPILQTPTSKSQTTQYERH